jgi:hypothetical protein
MRSDSALSHLYVDELCLVDLHDGTQHEMRWNRAAWRFFFLNTEPPIACSFDDIKEWRPASIRY